MSEIKRGYIAMANLPGEYSVQGGYRPVVIIQNDIGNKFSPTTIVVPLTSEIKKVGQPTHEVVKVEDAEGLKVDSMALCEQIRTIDKRKIDKVIGRIYSDFVMRNISNACMVSLQLA